MTYMEREGRERGKGGGGERVGTSIEGHHCSAV